MTTTRRSWIKSLVAMACGAFGVKYVSGSFDLANGRDWTSAWNPVPFGDDWPSTPRLPQLGDLYPETPAWACRIADALDGTPVLLDGEHITDDIVFHAEWRCEAVPTGWTQQRDGDWYCTFKASDVMTGSLTLNDNRCVAVLAHRENGVWRVMQCACTNLHRLGLTTETEIA